MEIKIPIFLIVFIGICGWADHSANAWDSSGYEYQRRAEEESRRREEESRRRQEESRRIQDESWKRQEESRRIQDESWKRQEEKARQTQIEHQMKMEMKKAEEIVERRKEEDRKALSHDDLELGNDPNKLNLPNYRSEDEEKRHRQESERQKEETIRASDIATRQQEEARRAREMEERLQEEAKRERQRAEWREEESKRERQEAEWREDESKRDRQRAEWQEDESKRDRQRAEWQDEEVKQHTQNEQDKKWNRERIERQETQKKWEQDRIERQETQKKWEQDRIERQETQKKWEQDRIERQETQKKWERELNNKLWDERNRQLNDIFQKWQNSRSTTAKETDKNQNINIGATDGLETRSQSVTDKSKDNVTDFGSHLGRDELEGVEMTSKVPLHETPKEPSIEPEAPNESHKERTNKVSNPELTDWDRESLRGEHGSFWKRAAESKVANYPRLQAKGQALAAKLQSTRYFANDEEARAAYKDSIDALRLLDKMDDWRTVNPIYGAMHAYKLAQVKTELWKATYDLEKNLDNRALLNLAGAAPVLELIAKVEFNAALSLVESAAIGNALDEGLKVTGITRKGHVSNAVDSAFDKVAHGEVVKISAKATRIPLNLTSSEIIAVRKVVGRHFDERFRTIWNGALDRSTIAKEKMQDVLRLLAADPKSAEAKKLAAEAYENVKPGFWRRVKEKPDLVKRFTDAGMSFSDTGGPFYQLPDGSREFLSLEHFVRKVDAPERAVDATNLVFSLAHENSIILEKIRSVVPEQWR